jgi:predicted HicB family RNase H-like nuclease
MELLKFKGYEGSIEVDMTRKVCRGKILFINDLITYESASPADLQHEFEEAVDDYLATCKELGREPQKPFRGLFNVRVPPAIHKAAVVRALSDGVTLNDLVGRALEAYLNRRPDQNFIIASDMVELVMSKTQQTSIHSSAAGPVTWNSNQPGSQSGH